MPVLHLPQLVGPRARARPQGPRHDQARGPADVGHRLVDLRGRRRRRGRLIRRLVGRRRPRPVARYAWPAGVATVGRRLVRGRLAAPPPRDRPRLRAARRVRSRRPGLPARGRGDHRRADLVGQRGRAARQRRPHLPLLPGDDPPGGEDGLHAHLRVLARRHRRRGRRRPVRARGRRGRVQRDHRRHGRRADEAGRVRADGRRRRPRLALPPAQALRVAAARQPHAPQDPRRRRLRRADRRRRDRGGVDRRRPGPRPLARHPRARARADRARAVRRVRRELARGDGRGARRRRLHARARGHGGRRPDADGALERGRRRHQRRGALLPRDRGGARVARPHRRLLRAAPGVHRGAGGMRRTRREGARARARRAHRQGTGAGRGARELRRPARRRRGDVRVRADDAAREVPGARRRVVLGRVGQLRQPLVPAPRRGDAVRAVARVRGRADGAVRAGPGGLGPDRAGAVGRPRAGAARRRRRR